MGGPTDRAAHSNVHLRVPLAHKAARLAPVCTDFAARSTQDWPETPVPERVGAPADGTVPVRSTGHASTAPKSILRGSPSAQPLTEDSKRAPHPVFAWRRIPGSEALTSSEDTIAPTSGLGALLSQDTVSACRGDACSRPALFHLRQGQPASDRCPGCKPDRSATVPPMVTAPNQRPPAQLVERIGHGQVRIAPLSAAVLVVGR